MLCLGAAQAGKEKQMKRVKKQVKYGADEFRPMTGSIIPLAQWYPERGKRGGVCRVVFAARGRTPKASLQTLLCKVWEWFDTVGEGLLREQCARSKVGSPTAKGKE